MSDILSNKEVILHFGDGDSILHSSNNYDDCVYIDSMAIMGQ
jgi:hypothetical protein